MKISSKISLFFIIIFFAAKFAFAAENFLPDDQEKRAHNLFLQIKCLVCEGQVIESSNAQFAFEMRKLIREKIANGQSDEEIKTFLVNNYGEEILNEPPVNKETALLWILPILFFLSGMLFLFRRKNFRHN